MNLLKNWQIINGINGKSVIGMNVYSRGTQQFRLLYSSKFITPLNRDLGEIKRPLLPLGEVNEQKYIDYQVQVLPCAQERHPLKGIEEYGAHLTAPSLLPPAYDIRNLKPSTVLPETIIRRLNIYSQPGKITTCSCRQAGRYRVFSSGRLCVIRQGKPRPLSRSR